MDESGSALRAPRTTIPSLLTVVLVTHWEQALVLAVAGSNRWHHSDGYTMIPLELPGLRVKERNDVQSVANEIARSLLGQSVTLVPAKASYGPSCRHAVDRLSIGVEAVPPAVIATQRMSINYGSLTGIADVLLRAYLAYLAGPPTPGYMSPALVLVPPERLRLLMLGSSLDELYREPEIRILQAQGAQLPEDGLLYVPGDHGERLISRVIAKYGSHTVLADGR